MKKLLVTMLAGVLIIGGTVLPVSAASETGKTNVGYLSGQIPDPDNPSNPTWSVSIPKDFVFTDGNLTKNVDVTLNEITGEFNTAKKVQVDVESKNTYLLKNTDSTVAVQELQYKLNYGSLVNPGVPDESGNVTNTIGFLSRDNAGGGEDPAMTITGTAVLEETQLTNIGVDGTYKDVLTYTVYSAVDK